MTNAPFADDQVFEKVASVRYRNLGDEAVVVEQEAGEMLVLNEAGAIVLDLAADGASVADIRQGLRQAFGIDKERAAGDAQTFLTTLLKEGILRVKVD